jgi:hypothetical protein
MTTTSALDPVMAAGETLAADARDAGTTTKARLSDAIRSSAGRLEEQAGTQQQRAADALRQTAAQLEAMSGAAAERGGPATGLVEGAAATAAAWADRLEQQSPRQLLTDAGAFAQRRPGVVLGAAALAGFMTGRVMKSMRTAASTDDQASHEPAMPVAMAAPSAVSGGSGHGPSVVAP